MHGSPRRISGLLVLGVIITVLVVVVIIAYVRGGRIHQQKTDLARERASTFVSLVDFCDALLIMSGYSAEGCSPWVEGVMQTNYAEAHTCTALYPDSEDRDARGRCLEGSGIALPFPIEAPTPDKTATLGALEQTSTAVALTNEAIVAAYDLTLTALAASPTPPQPTLSGLPGR
jgi:hypothetical protein